MADDTSTEVDVVDEEEEVEETPADHTADPVPGAVTEDTPEMTSKQKRAAGAPPLPTSSDGFVQLAATENVDDLGLKPGTRVRVVSVGPMEIDAENTYDPYHPVFSIPEDAEVVVQTRDAKSQTVTVNREDLEPVSPGSTKG